MTDTDTNTATVERYSVTVGCDGYPDMRFCESGGWVDYDDYKALSAERDALQRQLTEARATAACAYQSWKCNRFDVKGSQQALLRLVLGGETE